MRSLEVLVESEDGKPTRILDARGTYWLFNDADHLDRDELARTVMERMEAYDAVGRARRSKITDPRPELKMRDIRPGSPIRCLV